MNSLIFDVIDRYYTIDVVKKVIRYNMGFNGNIDTKSIY